jgi:hypothetical protein
MKLRSHIEAAYMVLQILDCQYAKLVLTIARELFVCQAVLGTSSCETQSKRRAVPKPKHHLWQQSAASAEMSCKTNS